MDQYAAAQQLAGQLRVRHRNDVFTQVASLLAAGSAVGCLWSCCLAVSPCHCCLPALPWLALCQRNGSRELACPPACTPQSLQYCRMARRDRN